MAGTMPTQRYITTLIIGAVYDLLWQKLNVEVGVTDLARLVTMKRGPLQDEPAAVNILVHENDIFNPLMWKHSGDVWRWRESQDMRFIRQNVAGRQVEWPGAQSFVGSGAHGFQRAFSIEILVVLDAMDYTFPAGEERAYLDAISGVVAGRARAALLAGGSGIGTGQAPVDHFGEQVIEGPYFGDEWVERPPSEALRATRRMQFWYRTLSGQT